MPKPGPRTTYKYSERFKATAVRQAIGQVKLNDGVSKKAGDPILASEVQGLEKIKLPAEEFPDCGHATLIRINDTWTVAFDFRYNREVLGKHIVN